MRTAVDATALTKSYAEGTRVVDVLRGVSFYALHGEFVMLVGPSGSGKTTLLSILGCVLRPTAGSLVIHGLEVAGLPDARLPALRRNAIGFVFQGHNLIASLSIEENIRLQLHMRGVAGPQANREASALLERVGLLSLSDRKPSELSGGQRQRVAIARAVAGRPPLILADEPTASLDHESGLAVTQILKELASEGGHTVITVTHDPRIFHFADRIEHLEDGRIVHGDDVFFAIPEVDPGRLPRGA